MRTMSIRDIRQRWPEAERALAQEGEIIVTRDSRPVARLLPIVGARPAIQQRVDFAALDRWRTRFWRGASAAPSSEELLERERADRR